MFYYGPVEKSEVRRMLRNRPVRKEDSQLLCSLLMENESIIKSSQLLLYYPLADEPDIRPLYSLDKQIALPWLDDEGNMEFSLFSGRLKKGKYNIMEPDERLPLILKDDAVIIIPALAYTSEKVRLGRGKGCYDRFLSRHHIHSIGVITADRVLDCFSVQPHDIRVDELVIVPLAERNPGFPSY